MFPAYPKKAHASGQARIRFRGRDYYLGKFGSDESRKEYARLVGDLAFKPDAAPSPRARPDRLTVAELVALWIAAHARHEAEQVAGAAKALVRLHGAEMAADFTAAKLETLRDALVDCSWRASIRRMGRGCRPDAADARCGRNQGRRRRSVDPARKRRGPGAAGSARHSVDRGGAMHDAAD